MRLGDRGEGDLRRGEGERRLGEGERRRGDGDRRLGGGDRFPLPPPPLRAAGLRDLSGRECEVRGETEFRFEVLDEGMTLGVSVR